MQDLWLLLQLSDSAFPTGGFVHSGGLEAAAHSGLVNDRETFYKYLISQMNQTIQQYIPIISVAYHSGKNMENFAQIDQFCQAVITNTVANRASRTQGIALLSTTATAFPWSDLASVKKFILPFFSPHIPPESVYLLSKDIIINNLYAHQATIFGLVYNILGIDLATTQQLFLFVTLRAFMSTAIRLNLIGPIEAQSIQFKVGKESNKQLELFLESQAQKNISIPPTINNISNNTDQPTDQPDVNNANNSNIKINSANTNDITKSIWNMEGKWNELENHLEVFQVSPLLDLVQGMQDRLYSRMFNS